MSIGGKAFSGCKGLTSIEIPDGVTSIDNYTFSNCIGLTKIEISDSVTSIGWSAFESCSNLTSVTIGNGVISIGESAFAWCGLTSITFYGTKAQWDTIEKNSWYFRTPIEKIICTDGEVTL